MRRVLMFPFIVAAALGALTFVASRQAEGQADGWTADFPVYKADLASTGRNTYFILEPGHTLGLRGGNDELIITVLNETKQVDGVETRVVEERHTKGGKLVEVARNYFAINKRTNDVYYFGEDVDNYKDGKVINHDGTWHSGVNGAKFGLMMPGRPSVNMRYYQEVSPKVAMDRARIISVTEKLKTKAGTFTNVLKVEETTPLEPSVTDYKYYAPGIGMVSDGEMKLVKVIKAGGPKK